MFAKQQFNEIYYHANIDHEHLEREYKIIQMRCCNDFDLLVCCKRSNKFVGYASYVQATVRAISL